jgi:secondary thiamine-phosphate synthase enzyme
MQIVTTEIEFSTRGNCAMKNITEEVSGKIRTAGFVEGNVLLFVVGSTGALTTIEFEPGLQQDYPELFEKLIPSNQRYHHDDTWNDGNGHSHLRASLQGPSLTIPFLNGKLLLGTWQQIIFIDFDNRPRKRKIIVQITGNAL